MIGRAVREIWIGYPLRPMPKSRRKPSPAPAPKRPRRLWLSAAVGSVAVVALGIAAVVTSTPQQPESRSVVTRPVVASTPPPKPSADTIAPKSLPELLALTPDELAKVDVALMNLLCAEGLPGSEGIDIPGTLATLDKWAERTRLETARYYPRFLRNPAENNNSEADFKMLSLITVLQLDLGVHYNMAKVNDPDFGNSKDQFIHGMVNCNNGGTCVSMPVLYVAVARRLGYPVRLVQAKEHIFVRWDDPKGERLNIDGAGQGMNTYPDSHYRQWPKPITDEEVARGDYLKSLSPEEELAVFLAARAHCLVDNGRFAEALEVYREAAKRLPTPDYQGFVKLTEDVIAGRVIPHRLDGTRIIPKPTPGP